MKFLKVGCFRSDDPIPQQIAALLAEFSKEPRKTDGSRTRIIGGLPILLRNIVEKEPGEVYLIDFARIRDEKNLPLGDIRGNEDEITFQDMRPANRAAAVLDLLSRSILIQENGSGITHSGAGRYLSALGGEDATPVRFKTAIDGEAQARMLKSGGFVKFSIGLAQLGDVDDLASFGFSDKDILRLTSGIDATNLTISYGVDRRRAKEGEQLNTDKVLEYATELLKVPRRYLKTLRLMPTEMDEEGLAIDLLNDRIVLKHPLSQKESEELPDEVRYRAVNAAWRKYRDALRKRYCP